VRFGRKPSWEALNSHESLPALIEMRQALHAAATRDRPASHDPSPRDDTRGSRADGARSTNGGRLR
jgi:hypothetical protein